MYAPSLNPREAQDIAQRSGNERLVFWTSIASLGFMGALAATETAKLVFDMVKRGEHGHADHPARYERRVRSRGR